MLLILAESSTTTAEESLLAIAVVILLGPFIVQRLRLPGLVGLVLGGTAIGPQGLGWMAPGQLDGLGQIGLLYLMFMAGLELDLGLLRRYRGAAVRFGLLTFTFPFVIGAVGSGVAGFSRTQAILFGSIWASHTLVALPEVKRAGLSANRAVAISVSATALTDTLALTVLAVVTSGASDSPGGSPMVKLGVGLVVLALYTLWLVPLVGSRVFRLVARDRTVRFVFLLGVFSSAALVASAFGIEGLVGAFLAGMGANRLVPAGGPLMERTEFVGSALFIPMFLIYVGTQLDPAALGSPETLELAAGYLAIVIVGKVLAAAASGRIERLGWVEVGLMSGLTFGQAAATLATTLVGQSVGLFDQQVVNAVLVTVLVIILISSVTTAVFARRISPEVEDGRPLGATVLLAVPAGGATDALVGLVTRLAEAHAGQVVPVRVVSQGCSPEERAAALDDLAAVVEEATRHGADVEGIVRIDTSVPDGVISAAAEHDASLIVVPWDPVVTRTERIFGRDLEEVGRRSSVPVIAGHVPDNPVERVLMPVEGPLQAGGARLDARVSVAFLEALSHAGIGVEVVTAEEGMEDALGMDAHSPLRPAVVRDLADVVAETSPEELLLLPAEQVGRGALRTAHLDARRAVLIMAGAYRLQTTGRPAAAGLAQVIGFQRTTSA